MSSDDWSAGPREPEPRPGIEWKDPTEVLVAFVFGGGWVLILIAFIWGVSCVGNALDEPSRPAPVYAPAYPGSGFAEDPAPGDDGTTDCGSHGPVWVGNNDPLGLDGDGDGWGCES